MDTEFHYIKINQRIALEFILKAFLLLISTSEANNVRYSKSANISDFTIIEIVIVEISTYPNYFFFMPLFIRASLLFFNPNVNIMKNLVLSKMRKGEIESTVNCVIQLLGYGDLKKLNPGQINNVLYELRWLLCLNCIEDMQVAIDFLKIYSQIP